MSHFTVLVIGDDVEGQLAPFSNKRWDWWVIGGRWSGFFKLKAGEDASGRIGEPGTSERMMSSPERIARAVERITERRADQALKGAIDFDAMRDEAGQKAGDLWDRARALIGDAPIRTWPEVREAHGEDVAAARKEYWSQSAARALRDSSDEPLRWMVPDEFRVSREDYVQHARNKAGRTFAVVKNGVWYERGEMGWFGFVSDEKDEAVWDAEFTSLIDGLPDDTLLTVVDCHI